MRLTEYKCNLLLNAASVFDEEIKTQTHKQCQAICAAQNVHRALHVWMRACIFILSAISRTYTSLYFIDYDNTPIILKFLHFINKYIATHTCLSPSHSQIRAYL